MKKLTLFLVMVLCMCLIVKRVDVIAGGEWSSSWEEYGEILAAYAETSSTSLVRKKDVPDTKTYHDGKTNTSIKCNGIKFDVKADKTLGTEYRVRFMEIYHKINTGLNITVSMDEMKFDLDKKTAKGYWKIIVVTKGYEVMEKVQKWDQNVVKSRPDGVTIYKKTTKYAPAKKSSSYKIVECD